MYRHAVPFFTAAGKTEADIRRIPALFRANPAEYWESRRRGGIRMERAYLQRTQMGIVTIIYYESEIDFAAWMELLGQSYAEFDHQFVNLLAEVHGVDVRTQPVARPETMAVWLYPELTGRRKGLAFAARLRPRTRAAGRDFTMKAYVQRSGEFAETRGSYGESMELLTTTPTPHGDVVCVYYEATDPVEANRRFATSTHPFDLWFKEQLRDLFTPDVDLSQPLPPIEE